MLHDTKKEKKKRKTEKTCAIPSHPKPTTNTQLPRESDQFTAAQQVSAILLSYSNAAWSPNPLQLLSEAFFTTKQLIGNRFSTRKTFIALDEVPITKPREAKIDATEYQL